LSLHNRALKLEKAGLNLSLEFLFLCACCDTVFIMQPTVTLPTRL